MTCDATRVLVRRTLVSGDYDPLAHVPDPNDRFQVFAYTRGAEIFVEIYD